MILKLIDIGAEYRRPNLFNPGFGGQPRVMNIEQAANKIGESLGMTPVKVTELTPENPTVQQKLRGG